MLQNPIGDADSEGSIEHKFTRGLSQKTVCVYAICSLAYLASHLCFLALLQNEFGIIILDQSFWHRSFCKCALPRCHHNFDRMTKFRDNRPLPLFPWLSTDLLNWVKVKWSPGVASCSPLIKTTSLFARGAWLWWWCREVFFLILVLFNWLRVIILNAAFPELVRKVHQSLMLPQSRVSIFKLLVEGDPGEVLLPGLHRLVVQLPAQLHRDRRVVLRVQDHHRAFDLTKPLCWPRKKKNIVLSRIGRYRTYWNSMSRFWRPKQPMRAFPAQPVFAGT